MNGVEKFFAVAQERYAILLRRCSGALKPWSADPIFNTEYFCNVFREDDKTTIWFRENIRDKVRNDPRKALLAIVAFRWFNKIETGEKIKEFLVELPWDAVKVHNRLASQKPVVTGAYIIKTPDGMTKLKGVLWCIEEFRKTIEKEKQHFDKLLQGGLSMQTACELLKHSPYLGNFMSWQICSDARQTCLLENAPDKDTWAQPGPGSVRGLGRVYYNNPNYFTYGSAKDEGEMLALMRDLSHRSTGVGCLPKLAVIDVSHQLCEFDKYCRAEEGGKMKRKYGGHKDS